MHEIPSQMPAAGEIVWKIVIFVSGVYISSMRTLPQTSKFWSANLPPTPLNHKKFATHHLIQKVRKNRPACARGGGWSYVSVDYNVVKVK